MCECVGARTHVCMSVHAVCAFMRMCVYEHVYVREKSV